jgi:hypothetical protein
MPPAFPPIQIVRTCGTVISIVTTERSLRNFSKRPAGGELSGWIVGVQSGGSIAHGISPLVIFSSFSLIVWQPPFAGRVRSHSQSARPIDPTVLDFCTTMSQALGGYHAGPT